MRQRLEELGLEGLQIGRWGRTHEDYYIKVSLYSSLQ
jgi:hypothetical protein